VYPDVLTAPFLELGATDARYYAALTPNALRFSPYTITAAALKSIHGIDERILVDDLGRMVQFFMLLMKEWAG
jgi:carboxypeptidase PM20D1